MANRFDDKAKTWDEKPDRIEMAVKFADQIKKFTANGQFVSALDYGCGTGNVSFLLKDYFSSITLADSSQGMLQQVKDKIEANQITHFEPILIDIEENILPKKFDVIYSLMALHHVNNVQAVLQKFSNILDLKGSIIIGDLVDEDGNFHAYPENQDVHFGFDRKELELMLYKAGLKLVTYNIFHEIIRDNEGTPKEYPLFVMVAQKQ